MTEESAAQLYHEGLALHGAGDLAGAATRYAAALGRIPGHPGALHHLGVVALQSGDAPRAVELIGHALARAPADGEALGHLALALQACGRVAEADGTFRAARDRAPGDAMIAANHGRLLAAVGRPDDAAAALRRAVLLQPDAAPFWRPLADASIGSDDALTAVRWYPRAAVAAPDDTTLHQNLLVACHQAGRIGRAHLAARHALALDPGAAGAWSGLGVAWQGAGDGAAASTCYRRALAIAPDDPDAIDNALFVPCFVDGVDDQAQFAAQRAWARRVEQPDPSNFADVAADPERRLRIGYVSPDFRAQVFLSEFEPVLAHHDRRAFEIVCFADVARPDARTRALRAMADGWVDLAGLDLAAMRDRVRAERPDIVVCLSGYRASRRLPFALRLAPLQVAYINHVSTTGLATMDARVTDAVLDPDGVDAWSTERLLRFASGHSCWQPPADAPAAGELPARRNGFITFGCFNNLAKITPAAIALWVPILAALPTSRLLIKAASLDDGWTRTMLGMRFAAAGIDPARLDLVGAVASHVDNLAVLARADIALDPPAFNGGISARETLWMGVPIVTLGGPSFVGRLGSALLTRVGLAELTAGDIARYRSIALDLARDLDRLEALRASLRARVRRSALCDVPAHVRELEASYRSLWRGWCAGRAAA